MRNKSKHIKKNTSNVKSQTPPLVGWGVFLVFIVMATTAMAQPLPPSTPSGNPVPVGQLIELLLLVCSVFFVKQKKKN